MRFLDSSILKYLSGEEFSNSLLVKLSSSGDDTAMPRSKTLCEICKGKRVIHIGFADHIPLIKEKRKNGTWLHSQLCEVSELCYGLDINSAAVTYCKEVEGINNVFQHNIVADEPLDAITSREWDVAILGEIVEHLSNPVDFLTNLKTKYGKCIKKLIITVPNAFDVSNFFYARASSEYINSDHRFWFTPYTIAKLCGDSGFTPVDFCFADQGSREFFALRWLRRKHPMLRQTIIATFGFE